MSGINEKTLQMQGGCKYMFTTRTSFVVTSWLHLAMYYLSYYPLYYTSYYPLYYTSYYPLYYTSYYPLYNTLYNTLYNMSYYLSVNCRTFIALPTYIPSFHRRFWKFISDISEGYARHNELGGSRFLSWICWWWWRSRLTRSETHSKRTATFHWLRYSCIIQDIPMSIEWWWARTRNTCIVLLAKSNQGKECPVFIFCQLSIHFMHRCSIQGISLPTIPGSTTKMPMWDHVWILWNTTQRAIRAAVWLRDTFLRKNLNYLSTAMVRAKVFIMTWWV